MINSGRLALRACATTASDLSVSFRLHRLEKISPSWMRAASGTAKALLPAFTTTETAWQECPMMYAGLVLLSDSWCNNLTPGIFLPALGILIPSASKTTLSFTRAIAGKNQKTSRVQRRARWFQLGMVWEHEIKSLLAPLFQRGEKHDMSLSKGQDLWIRRKNGDQQANSAGT